MAAESFDRALALVLDLEGGFVADPRDPGGATRYGITRATLSRARGRPASVADVKALTRAEAGAIYRKSYWAEVGGDALPPGLDLAIFDFGVNSGPARAIKALQDALGVTADGRLGPATRAALASCDPAATVRRVTADRLGFMRRLSTWTAFGRGWTARVTRVERESLALARASPSPAARPLALVSIPVNQEGPVMDTTKSVLASRTVWANLIGLASVAFGVIGVDTSNVDAGGLAEAMSQIVAGISFVASTIFRVQATKQIGTPAS